MKINVRGSLADNEKKALDLVALIQSMRIVKKNTWWVNILGVATLITTTVSFVMIMGTLR